MRRSLLLLALVFMAQLALAQQPTNQAQTAGSATATAASGVQKVGISDSLANPLSAFPGTFLRTTDEPHQVFYDPFDSALDTTNRWTTPTVNAPGVIAAVSAGQMTMGTGATASGWSKLTTQNTFPLSIPAWMGFSFAISLNDGAAPNANATRFWGTGSIPSTPTTAVPITDGVGFEMSGTKMYAVVYANGTRTAVQDLSSATGNSTQPTDANQHRYIIYVRTDKTYWYIDGLTSANLVATSNFQAPNVQTTGESLVAVGNGSNAANSTIICNGAVVWDTGKNASQLADGTYPWRKATVSATGALSNNLAQIGGNTTASSGVNGLLPIGGYSSQNTSDAAWTSATSNNTRVTLISNIATYNSILVTLVQGSTITGGSVTLQQSNDNTNWIGVQCVNVGTTVIMGPTYALVASTNVMFMCPVSAPYFGVLLSPAITGTGTVTVGHNALTLPSVGLLAGSETLAAGTNNIGNVQITDGTNSQGAMANFGTSPGAVKGLNVNSSLFIGTTLVSSSNPFPISATGAANTKTNEIFSNITDHTNSLSAALSALGTAPTGTEVMAVNAVHLPSTAAGAALSSAAQATLTSSVNVKASAGNVYGVSVLSGATSGCWLEFVNSASAGTLGTAVIFSVALPNAGILTLPPGALALGAFSSGIAMGVATTNGGSTACGTSSSVTVFYK